MSQPVFPVFLCTGAVHLWPSSSTLQLTLETPALGVTSVTDVILSSQGVVPGDSPLQFCSKKVAHISHSNLRVVLVF